MEHHKRLKKRIEIRARLQAGEPVPALLKVYPFMRPRRLALRVQRCLSRTHGPRQKLKPCAACTLPSNPWREVTSLTGSHFADVP